MSMRVLFLFLLFMPLGMMAQEAEESDFTSDLFGGSMQMPDVLPKGRLQWEPYAFYQRETYEGSKYYTWSPLAFLLRYGINSTTELRFQSTIMHTTDDEEGNNRGIADLAIGFKTNLFEGWKAVPTISLMGNVYIPGGERFRYLPSQFGGELDLLFANDLASWCRLGYMGGSSGTTRPVLLFCGEPIWTLPWPAGLPSPSKRATTIMVPMRTNICSPGPVWGCITSWPTVWRLACPQTSA